MKNVNKIVSLASVAAMLVSVTALPVSASQINAYSVSYETLAQAIETTDGNTIPAGSVAVTMSVVNNTGFSSNTLTLDIAEGYHIITNDENKPVIQKNEVLAEANVAGASSPDGTTFCVAVASGMQCESDGQMFTVYFEKNQTNPASDFVSVQNTEAKTVSEEDAAQFISPASVSSKTYIVGDVDNDTWVNSYDASLVATAISKYNKLHNSNKIPVEDFLKQNLAEYFPDAKYYLAPDAVMDGSITNLDVQGILEYAAGAGAGNPYYGWIGKELPIIE